MPVTDVRLLLRVASSDSIRPRARLGSAIGLECTVLDQDGAPIAGAVVTLSVVGLLTVPGLVAGADGKVTASVTPQQAAAFVAQAVCAAPLAETAQRIFDVIATDGDPQLSPPWVDAATGALIFPPGQPVTAQDIAALPSGGALQAGDALPGVRNGAGVKLTGASVLDAAADATFATLGAQVIPVPITGDTALTKAQHGAKWLLLTGSGGALSAAWADTGIGFSTVIVNDTSYHVMPVLTGFTTAEIRGGAVLGVKPGGTGQFYCVEWPDGRRLGYLIGQVA